MPERGFGLCFSPEVWDRMWNLFQSLATLHRHAYRLQCPQKTSQKKGEITLLITLSQCVYNLI